MGPQEGLLQRVLAVLEAAEHVAAEGEQRRVMALVEHLERSLVALAHKGGEPCVVEPAVPAGCGAFAHAPLQTSGRAIHSRGGLGSTHA